MESDMEADKIRKAWNEAYKPLVSDISDTLTLEEICCMFFELGWNAALERNSIIHWQVGEPKESGFYLVHTKSGYTLIDHYIVPARNYILGNVDKSEVTAWCKISDIQPYKEEIK